MSLHCRSRPWTAARGPDAVARLLPQAGLRFVLRCACAWISFVLAGSRAARAEEPPHWELQAGVLGAVPTSPGDFRDGWGPGWGMEAFVGRRLGERAVLGVEGRFQQHRFDGTLPDNEIGGRERRLSSVAARFDVVLWRAPVRRDQRIVFELGGGYVHQYIAPVTGTFPLPFGPADGYGVSAGASYSLGLNDRTRFLFGARHAWVFLPDETVDSLALRFGVAVGLAGDER
jgi:hypothetical protein